MPAKNTINISLTDEHLKDVEELMNSGEYGSKSEIFRESLKKQVERLRFKKFIKQQIAAGEASGSVEINREEMKQRLYKVVDQLKAEKEKNGS